MGGAQHTSEQDWCGIEHAKNWWGIQRSVMKYIVECIGPYERMGQNLLWNQAEQTVEWNQGKVWMDYC